MQRAYYFCHRCGGSFPWDQEVGLTSQRLTPGAERAASMAGLLTDSFDEAARKVLPELAGLRLSESTVQRTTEAAGERLGERLDEGKVLGGPTPWKWRPDAEGKTCAYVSVDVQKPKALDFEMKILENDQFVVKQCREFGGK